MSSQPTTPLQIGDGNVFYTSQGKPCTLFFNDQYQLCDAPPPTTYILERYRAKTRGPQEKKDAAKEADETKPVDPAEEALQNALQLCESARACVSLFFYFVHENDDTKPVLCTQGTGFFVAPTRIVTAYHHLSRHPEGYVFAECFGAATPNANMLTLREREKFGVTILDPERLVDKKMQVADEDPFAKHSWDPSNDVLFLAVTDEKRKAKCYLLPLSKSLGRVRGVSLLGYPVFLLHDKDIADNFPENIIHGIEDELNPNWRKEEEKRMQLQQQAAAPTTQAPAPAAAPVTPQRVINREPSTFSPVPPGVPPNQRAASPMMSDATVVGGTGPARSPVPPKSSGPQLPPMLPPNAVVTTNAGTDQAIATAAPTFVPGTFTVLVHEARNLWSAQLVGKQDPYAVVTMTKHKQLKYSTEVAKSGGKNPTFLLQHFPFDVKEPGLKLRIEVYNKNIVGSDDYIGRGYLMVDDLIQNPTRQWYRIGRDANERTDAGEVSLSFLYLPIALVDQATLRYMLESQHLPPKALNRLALFSADMHNPPAPIDLNSPVYWHRSIGTNLADDDDKEDENRKLPGAAETGDKMLDGTMTVVVTGARNLYNPAIIGSLDPYCVVSMTKHKRLTYKTQAVKGGGKNVSFELEHFPFDVKERGLKLRIELYNKNLVSDDFIGRTYLWVDEMIKNPQHQWYRMGRDAGERTDAGEVALAVLYMPLDPEEVPEAPEIDRNTLEQWAVHFLGEIDATKLKGKSVDDILKAVNDKRKKEGFDPLEMPWVTAKSKFDVVKSARSSAFERTPTIARSPSTPFSATPTTQTAQVTQAVVRKSSEAKIPPPPRPPRMEPPAVRSVLRNLHRQFFYGYDRLLCNPGRLRWGEENDVDTLQHVTTSLTKGMCGGPLVITSFAKQFIGLAIGGYNRTKMNVMLSVYHPAFIWLYLRFVLPSFGSSIPDEVYVYLSMCEELGRVDERDLNLIPKAPEPEPEANEGDNTAPEA